MAETAAHLVEQVMSWVPTRQWVVSVPSDADVADVVTKISQRVICKLRKLGYLEAGMEATVATGHDPLVDEEPELAPTLAASVQQRIAFGERAFTRPWSDGTTGIKLSPLELLEKLAPLVPPPRVHQVRWGSSR